MCAKGSASVDYIGRELGKTVKGRTVSLGDSMFKYLLLTLSVLWIPAVAGLAWVYEYVGREAGIIVALGVTLCWHLAKNRKLVKKEGGLYIPFSFYFLFFVVLLAVNLSAQFYRSYQFGFEHFIAHLNYFELLCQSSLIPVIAVMTLAELWRFLFVDKLDKKSQEDLEYYVAVISPQSEFQRGKMTK
jgi:hypothetical protein